MNEVLLKKNFHSLDNGVHSLANLLLVESGDGVECVEADEAAVLGLAELAAEIVRHPLVGQQLVEPEQVPQDLQDCRLRGGFYEGSKNFHSSGSYV